MTKVFTSLLLADMVQRGEVALTDPVAKYLPPDVKVPERGGKKITLVDLATHTSGLPRMPSNFTPKDPANPYADYSVEQMYEFLSAVSADARHRLEVRVLELRRRTARPRAGAPRRHRLRDAGADAHSGAAGDEEHRDHAVAGDEGAARHRSRRRASAGRELGPADARRRRRAAVDRERPADVPRREHRHRQVAARTGDGGDAGHPPADRHPRTSRSRSAGTSSRATDDEIVWHNGGTGGYRTFIGFDPQSRIGVVVLSNTSTTAGRRRHRRASARSAPSPLASQAAEARARKSKVDAGDARALHRPISARAGRSSSPSRATAAISSRSSPASRGSRSSPRARGSSSSRSSTRSSRSSSMPADARRVSCCTRNGQRSRASGSAINCQCARLRMTPATVDVSVAASIGFLR